ncbi:toprim domain-containing protein [Aneurinibacillus sp. BA2021]|nr:toprim domain-containing protein [Aneurinibacillus sp. BA2021]
MKANVSDTKRLKAECFHSGKVKDVLEAMGVRYVKLENKKRWTGALPDGDNRRSVQVTNDRRLLVNIYTRGIEKTDIFGLIAYMVFGKETGEEQRKALPLTKKWLKEQIGWDEKMAPPERYVQTATQKESDKEVSEKNQVLDELILSRYESVPYLGWHNEGISADTQKEFEVAMDLYTGRVVFPIRNSEGELVSVKGRTVTDDPAKYLYLYSFEKSFELFNFYRAKSYILESGQVIVFEGEKSVMLAWEYGYRHAVALAGKDVSKAQAQMIKNLGDDIEVILAFDKGVTGKYVAEQARKFLPLQVSTVYDDRSVLEDKMAPVDQGREAFEQLMAQRFLFRHKVRGVK